MSLDCDENDQLNDMNYVSVQSSPIPGEIFSTPASPAIDDLNSETNDSGFNQNMNDHLGPGATEEDFVKMKAVLLPIKE